MLDSMPIKFLAVPGVPETFTNFMVRSVSSKYGALEILVEDTPVDSELGVRICFGGTYGFRVLDEGDLLDFWSGEFEGNSVVYQVLNGGWLAQEQTRSGFIGAYSGWAKEYFVLGQHDCVNVIATGPPTIEVISIPLQ